MARIEVELLDKLHCELSEKAREHNVSVEYYAGFALWDYLSKMRAYKILISLVSAIAGAAIGLLIIAYS